MTMTMTMPDRSSRGLLVASLALNLFFIGTAGALAVRHYVAPPQTVMLAQPRSNAAARIERLAVGLPKADGDLLRAAFRAREAETEAVRERLNRSVERVQAALRAQPFDPAAVRVAMAEARAARPAYEQAMHDIIVTAAASMSQEGRTQLGSWPPQRPATNPR
jgi:uncharacterized membrane protein